MNTRCWICAGWLLGSLVLMGSTLRASPQEAVLADSVLTDNVREKAATKEPKAEGISEHERSISLQLDAPSELTISDLTLAELPKFLSSETGLPVVLDSISIEAAEIDPQVILKSEIAGSTLRGVLHHALHSLGLRAVVEHDLVIITVDPDARALVGGKNSRWISIDDRTASESLLKLQDTTDLAFDMVPLREAMRRVSLLHKIKIGIDSRALENSGLKIDEPVFANIAGLKLIDLLRLTLDSKNLELTMANNVLLVTTADDAESHRHLLVRSYSLDGTGFVGPTLASVLIQTVIDPNHWEVLGGAGTLMSTVEPRTGRCTLYIASTLYNHLEIEALLEGARSDQRKTRSSLSTPAFIPYKLPSESASNPEVPN